MQSQVKDVSNIVNDGAKCVVTIALLQKDGNDSIIPMLNELQESIIAKKYLFILLEDTSKNVDVSQLQGNVLQVWQLGGTSSSV